jgi:hypothetical protein
MLKVNSITVVGGGTAGWMTASTIIKAYPNLSVNVIEPQGGEIIGVGESTIGGIRQWTNFIGLEDSDFLKETDGSYKLSIKFTDFYEKNGESFQYPFGEPYLEQSPLQLMDWFYKKHYYPETPWDDYVRCLFPTTYLYENNKFNENRYQEFNNFNIKRDIAFHFDSAKFGAYLKNNYCVPNGVKIIDASVVDIITGEDGIESLILDNGESVTSDLYIDCTGFKSLLLGGAMNEPFDSWADRLPNNRAWATRIEYKDKELELEGFTNSTAIENGWCWNIPLWSRLGAGYVYSDKFIDPEDAKEEFKQYLMSDRMVIPRTREEVDSLEFKSIPFKVGMYERTFVKNVVGIGLSAAFIEPLESNGLYSIHEFLFKLVDILDREQKISQYDRDIFNASCKNLFSGFAQFVGLHYALSHRCDTEYWKAVSNREFDKTILDNFAPKVQGYADFGLSYMDKWEYVTNRAGIPYIATGMHVNMINASRVRTLEEQFGIDYKRTVDEFIRLNNINKAKWQAAADLSPTLYQYLKDNFYSEETEEVV